MPTDSSIWNAQKRGWRTLKQLHAASIDLQRISLIRDKTPEYLSQPENLERLLLELGLNDEGMNEFPASLHPFCGPGLRIWQYPAQFSKYLAQLCRFGVRSYLELGVRHGGSFVATVEILERFSPLEFAVGVDVIPCPSMAEYRELNPRIEFACINTQSADFNALLERLGPIDLVFIDSHHEEAQCRREFASVRDRAKMVAFHDISNVNCPGIARVWNDVKAMGSYACYEYIDQYDGMGPYMGIGLAVPKSL
jgi:methyltransferase family protein